MQHVLYIDESGEPGLDRFDQLARRLGQDATLQFFRGPTVPAVVSRDQRWDMFVADIRGLATPQQTFLDQLGERNPDAAFVLITEALDDDAAEAMLRHGAIDCLTWNRGADRLVKTLRRTLTRLMMTRRAIRALDSCVEELDVTLAIDRSPKCANTLARYALRHLARMDVCSLRSQFRAIRAFEETLEKVLQKVRVKTPRAPIATMDRTAQQANFFAGGNRSSWSGADPMVAQVRIHLSRAGLRFTLRTEAPLPLQHQSGQSASRGGSAAIDGLWFTPLLMDEISVDEDRHELTMLKLPDDVCSEVSQAIARHRIAGDDKHDVLGDVLKGVEQREGNAPE